MFSLEHAVAVWRRQMAASGIKSAEVLDELESHLRDDVEEQVRSGAEVEPAFDSAVRRIGTAATLRNEFAKSNRLQGKASRRFMRILYFISAAVAVLIDLWTLISFELSTVERLAGSCALAGFAWYLGRLPFSRLLRGVPHARFLGMLKIGSILLQLWTLLALLTALRVVQVEVGVVTAMVMWSLCAAFVLTLLACTFNGGYGDESSSGGWLSPTRPAPRPMPPNRPHPPGSDMPLPPSSAFTPTAQRALEVAHQEALRLGHDFVGTEHVLLGVLKMSQGVLAQVFQSSNMDREAVRMEIHRLISPLQAQPVTTEIPLTPRARKALQLARGEAAGVEHRSIGTEHIFLGLLLEGGGVAALALRNLGIRIERMRYELHRAWAQP
jgi:hypothetical protein